MGHERNEMNIINGETIISPVTGTRKKKVLLCQQSHF